MAAMVAILKIYFKLSPEPKGPLTQSSLEVLG